MNEVLAVIYYCYLKHDSHKEVDGELDDSNAIIPRKYIESDLFFSFSNIMTELRDGFLRELDKEKSGI